MQHVENILYGYLLNKYLKCSVWRLAVRYDVVRRQRVKFKEEKCPYEGITELEA
jgi:hypothetical protein